MGQQVDTPPSKAVVAAAGQQMQNLLDGAWSVRDAAELRRKLIRDAFERLAQNFCAHSLEQQRVVVSSLTDQELFDFIVADVKNRLDEGLWYKKQYDDQVDQIALATQALTKQLAEAHQTADELRSKLSQAEQAREDITAANRGYTNDIAGLQAKVKLLERAVREAPDQPAKSRATAPTSDPAAETPASPEWLDEWMQSTTYNLDAAFLRLVGTSDECRRQVLIEQFVKQERSHESVSGADNKIVDRLVKAGLLISKPVAKIRGNAPHLLGLGVKGKEAYRLIFNEDPRAVYDRYLAAHRSLEQMFLMLQACDALTGAGFQIDRFPPIKLLPDNKIFAPDLKVWRGRDELFIEIETDSYKDEPQRQAKWHTIAAGTNGYIYVITRDDATASRVRSEIMQKRYNRPVTIGVVSLSNLMAASQAGEALWGDMRTVS